MSRIFPYPLLTIGLTLMWLLLQQSVGLGHILFGFVVAFFASHAMARLQPHKPKVRRPLKILRLFTEVTLDILRSNIAVASILLSGKRRETTAGFVTVPLEIRDPMALAILSCIITATPGSAWLEYNPEENDVLIHVLDLIDEQEWVDTVKRRYETLLLEIFQ
jgi:multicomponent K+:H+ antiporter subunit E